MIANIVRNTESGCKNCTVLKKYSTGYNQIFILRKYLIYLYIKAVKLFLKWDYTSFSPWFVH